MIRYDLRCPADHAFDSWFQSADGFDRQLEARQIACPTCGATDVAKGMMAPSVRSGRSVAVTDVETDGLRPDVAEALAALRRKVEESSDYVGGKFATEARAMHLGDAPARAIHGEARPDEARQLLEDGIPVVPLPFLPSRRTN